MLSVRPDRPVDPLTVEVLRTVDRVLKSNALEYFVTGATARDILLSNVYGLPVERATRDIDLAIATPSWPAFERIKSGLVATTQFSPDDRLQHRLYYGKTDRHRGYPVDVLPFGGVETSAREIAWPPDEDIRMNVIGYEESLEAALTIQIANELAIRFPSVPSLAALKLLAWKDRRRDTGKDALDLAQLLRTYGEAVSQDRLYGSEIRLLEAAGFDLQLAGARLLGADIRAAVRPATTHALIDLLVDAQLREQLQLHMAPAFRGSDDAIQAIERLLAPFSEELSKAS